MKRVNHKKYTVRTTKHLGLQHMSGPWEKVAFKLSPLVKEEGIKILAHSLTLQGWKIQLPGKCGKKNYKGKFSKAKVKIFELGSQALAINSLGKPLNKNDHQRY